MKGLLTHFVILASLSLPTVLAQGTNPTMLTASDGTPLDRFGSAVAIDGNYAIVGAPGHSDDGVQSGAAYIFRNEVTTWTEIAKLTASDAATGDQFGFSVALEGNYAVVGAPEKDDVGPFSGAVYIFQRNGNTWTETAKLAGTGITQDSHFGWSVTIDGDYVSAGAIGTDKEHPGLVYVFRHANNNWLETANFFTPIIGEGDNFGSHLSISGDYLVVGDENFPAGGASGIAYIFRRNDAAWTNVASLTARDAAAGDQFGWNVFVDGDVALVSAPGDDEGGENSGAAYIFQREDTRWIEVAKLVASDAVAGNRFGWSASLRLNFAVIGAIGPENVTPGTAYIFLRNDETWSEIAKLNSPLIGEGDLFGSSVSISDKDIIVGDENHPPEMAVGAAYIYPIALLPVGINDSNNEIPANFVLYQNYPNPFNPVTIIRFSLPYSSVVTLKVFNLLGEEVSVLISQSLPAGTFQTRWDASQMPGGLYFYRLRADDFVETKKFILIK